MLHGNKALVTGASRGIGLGIAKTLAENGCKVIITGRNKEALEKACDIIGRNAARMVWDVSDVKASAEKIEEAAKQMDGLDIVVNNAGIFAQISEWSKDTLLKTTEEEWNSVIQTNASSVFFIMQASVNYMLSHQIKGNILNITSVAGYEPVYGAYGASKIAAIALTKGWGRMFAGDGITINGIAPGPVATAMNHWSEGDSMENNRIPYGRYASVEEISSLALYLLDEKAKMICGETIILDGGYAIR